MFGVRLNIKSLSLVLILSFGLDQIVLADSMMSATAKVQVFSKISAVKVPRDPSQLLVPQEYAVLKESHMGTNGKFIIHIQDPHSNYSGQMNVANTLDYYFRQYDIPLVFTEGGAKDSTLSTLRNLAPLTAWRQSSKKFLAEGVIDGIEYLNLTTDYPIKILGVENRELYEKNIMAYSELKDKHRKALNYLHKVKLSLQRVKNKLYPQEILDHEERVKNSHRFDKSDIQEKMISLISMFGSLDPKEYPESFKFKQIQKIEASINFESLNREAKELMGKLPRFIKISRSQLNDPSTLRSLLQTAKNQGLKLNGFRGLSLYEKYLTQTSELSMEKLLYEIGIIEQAVYKRYLQGNDLRKIMAIEKYVEYLEKAYQIKLSSDEFNHLKINKPDFPTIPWLAFLNTKLEELGYYEELIGYDSILDDAQPLIEKFYSIVEKRDSAFLDNIKLWMDDLGESTGFLVAGGYHTDNLTKLLKEEGYSYVVLRPLVLHETNRVGYEKVLLSYLEADSTYTLDLPTAASRLSSLKKLTSVLSSSAKSRAEVVINNIFSRPDFIKTSNSTVNNSVDGSRLSTITTHEPIAYSSQKRSELPSQSVNMNVVTIDESNLSIGRWGKRVNTKPFTQWDREIFNQIGYGGLAMQEHEVLSVTHSVYNSKEGFVTILVKIITTEGDVRYFKLRGSDTTSMAALKTLQPKLDDLKHDDTVLQISMGNQGDRAGNWNILPKEGRWEYFGAADEPLGSKSYYALIEFKGNNIGRRALGIITAERNSEDNQISTVTFQAIDSPEKIILDPYEVEFILAANVLGWDDIKSSDLLKEQYVDTHDLRHVFDFPYLEIEKSEDEVSKQFAFSNQLASSEPKRVAAFDGHPIVFDLLDYDSEPIRLEAIVNSLSMAGYQQRKGRMRWWLAQNRFFSWLFKLLGMINVGDYYIQGSRIHLILQPSVYPANLLAVSSDGKKLASITVEGQSGRKGANYWNIFNEVKNEMRVLGLGWEPYALFSLDNGMDPTVRAFDASGNVKKVMVQGRNDMNATLNVRQTPTEPKLLSDHTTNFVDDGEQLRDYFQPFSDPLPALGPNIVGVDEVQADSPILFPRVDHAIGHLVGYEERDIAHQKGFFHDGVQAYVARITDEGVIQVLRQKRSESVDISKGRYDQSLATQFLAKDGGDPEKALIRGLEEELGVLPHEVRFARIGESGWLRVHKKYEEDPDVYNREFISLYLVVVDREEITSSNPKVDRVEWVDWDEYVDQIRNEPDTFAKTARFYVLEPEILHHTQETMRALLQGESLEDFSIRRCCYYSYPDQDDVIISIWQDGSVRLRIYDYRTNTIQEIPDVLTFDDYDSKDRNELMIRITKTDGSNYIWRKGDLHPTGKVADQDSLKKIHSISKKFRQEIERLRQKITNSEDVRLLTSIELKFNHNLKTLISRILAGDVILIDEIDTREEASERKILDEDLVLIALPGTFDPPQLAHIDLLLDTLTHATDRWKGERKVYATFIAPVGEHAPGPDGVSWKGNKTSAEHRHAMSNIAASVFSPLIQSSFISLLHPDDYGTNNALRLLEYIGSGDDHQTDFVVAAGSDTYHKWGQNFSDILSSSDQILNTHYHVWVLQERSQPIPSAEVSLLPSFVSVIDDRYPLPVRSTVVRSGDSPFILPSVNDYALGRQLYQRSGSAAHGGARLAVMAPLLSANNQFGAIAPKKIILSVAKRLIHKKKRLEQLTQNRTLGSMPIQVVANNQVFSAVLTMNEESTFLHGGSFDNAVELDLDSSPSEINGSNLTELEVEVRYHAEGIVNLISANPKKKYFIAVDRQDHGNQSFQAVMLELANHLSGFPNVIMKISDKQGLNNWIESLKPHDRDNLVVIGDRNSIDSKYTKQDSTIVIASIGVKENNYPTKEVLIDSLGVAHLAIAMVNRDYSRVRSIYERVTGDRLKTLDDYFKLLAGQLIIYPRLHRILVNIDRIRELAREVLTSA